MVSLICLGSARFLTGISLPDRWDFSCRPPAVRVVSCWLQLWQSFPRGLDWPYAVPPLAARGSPCFQGADNLPGFLDMLHF